MAHRRAPLLFKFVNVLILAILFAALATIYWFAWRPTAQTSGRIDAPVAASVSVVFDRLAVPHIRANGLDDALFAQGFVTAQERIFQMDLLRRYNAGELSEIFGPSMLETDRESRRLRLRRVAEAAYLTIPAADRSALAAYTRPATGSLVNGDIANWGTLTGALCFSVAGLLQLGEHP